MGKRIRKKKKSKYLELMGWDEKLFTKIENNNRNYSNIIYLQNKWCAKQLLTTCPLMPSQSPSSSCPWPAPHRCKVFFTLCHILRNIPLACWLSWFYSLPASCAPSATLAGWLEGQYKKLKNPWLCAATAQQQLKHRCVISIVFLPQPKHSIVRDTVKKKSTVSQLKPIHPISSLKSKLWRKKKSH